MNSMADDVVSQNFQNYRARIDCFLKRRGVDEMDREDIIQDTFLRSLNCLNKTDEDYTIAILLRTARNLQIDLYRKRKVRKEEPGEDLLNNLPDDNDTSRDTEQKRLISRLLQTLETDNRSRFFQMHFDQELGIAEIARITGTPQGTVASQITRYKSQFYKNALKSMSQLDYLEA